jgi:hypothetical protein
MFDHVNQRLQEQKTATDTLVKREEKIKAKKRRDSITGINKEMAAKFKKQTGQLKK